MTVNFIDNKYSRWYYAIVANAQCRVTNGYTETHHIIPKSLGGTDLVENLVVLTAREHFICHRLLTKMAISKKHQYQMWNAFSCMLYRERPGQKRYKVSSRIFENIKKEGSKIKSWKMSGEKNPMFGNTHSAEARLKMSNWHLGKTVSEETRDKLRNNMLGKLKAKKKCLHCQTLAAPHMLERWHNDNCKENKCHV
jgi:hypothetical protein